MRLTAPILTFLTCLGVSTIAAAADVKVSLAGVQNERGHLIVSLCTEAEFLKDCQYTQKIVPQKPVSIVWFKDIPPGRYGVQAHHDENDNGKMDYGLFGVLPAEAYGFSRRGRLYSEPKYDRVAFDLPATGTEMTIDLQYP